MFPRSSLGPPPPRVGLPAPALHMRGARAGQPTLTIASLDGQPAVLAFLDDGSPFDGQLEELDAVRAELRGLGAVLIVLSGAGLFLFRPDDEMERFARASELDAGDVTDIQAAFGLERCAGGLSTPALFVIDCSGVLRFAHVWRSGGEVSLAAVTEALGAAGRAVVAARRSVLVTRRELVVTSLVAGFALMFLDACDKPESGGKPAPAGTGSPALRGAAATDGGTPEGETEITLDVNGALRKLRIDPRTTLLDALRERLGLPGTKKGCDHGQCGACTVHVDGRRVNSCPLFASMVEGKKIVTIEGLARGDDLHPMQAAFVAEDALQCGYCTLTSAAVALDVQGGNIKQARVALGGLSTKPWRSKEAEQKLVGQRPSKDLFRVAAEAALAGAVTKKDNAFKVELGKRTIVRALELVGGPS